MRTRIIQQKECPFYPYWKGNTTGSKNVRNTVNYILRNVMTAVSKNQMEWTANEREVMTRVAIAIPFYNQARLAAFYEKHCGKKDRNGKLYNRPKPLRMPRAGKWFLPYEFLDFLLKSEHNEAYYSCTSQVNQQAIRRVVKSWKSYFALVKKYKKDPSSFRGKPGLPKYIRTPECTAHFTNQVCRLVVEDGKAFLSFTNCDGLYPIGPDPGMELVKVEVIPMNGKYHIHITFQDSVAEVPVPEHPERILGLDIGTNNLVTLTNNFGKAPVLIDGSVIKAANQWFNKEKARATGIMTAGHDPKDRSVQRTSRYTEHLSERRSSCFRDWFYRIGHFVFRYAKDNQAEVVVIGHNKEQKQGIGIGRVNNQNFVSIPFWAFRSAMQFLSVKYGIPVVLQEESYTSKASLLDMDPIPAYGEEHDKSPVFSGKRVKRGLYQAKDGTLINADVCGGGNIIRKAYPDAFCGQNDLSYLYKTTRKVFLQDILDPGHKRKKSQAVHKKAARKSANAKARAHEKRRQKVNDKIRQARRTVKVA